MGTLALLWANPLARKVVLYVGLAASLLGLWWAASSHYERVGRDRGREEGKQETQQVVNSAVQDERKAAAEKISNAQADRDAAMARVDALSSAVSKLVDANKSIVQARAQASAVADKIPDAQLHPANLELLGMRLQGDTTPGYSAGEERGIFRCLSDRPLCQQSVDNLAGQVEKLQQRTTEIQTALDATDRKYQALAQYDARLEAAYVVLYNLRADKGSKFVRVVTFGLKGKPKTLPVPDPKDLLATKGK